MTSPAEGRQVTRHPVTDRRAISARSACSARTSASVAIVGSVMSSAYGSHVVSALTKDGAPATLTSAAQQSVVAGLRVAGHLPSGVREGAAEAVRQAFINGLHSGSLVATAATAAAALITLAFLPARVRPARPAAAGAGQPGKVSVPAGRNTADREMVR